MNYNFAYFGGEPLSVPTLDKLHEQGFIPRLIISNPDKPKGRNLEITSPPTAIWAKEHNIPLIQPESNAKLLSTFSSEEFGLAVRSEKKLEKMKYDFFIVVSYGKIIPKEILDLPKLGTINIHPSLLPKYRGPSPIVSPVLNGDSQTGVTIIQIDEEMDHGPILAQEEISLKGDENIGDLEKSLALLGGELLIKIIPEFVAGKIKPIEQDHSKATFCKKIKKEDGLIDLNDEGVKNYNKFRAYATWPRTFLFRDGKRVIITDAVLEDGKFVIKKVIPEGGKEVDYKN